MSKSSKESARKRHDERHVVSDDDSGFNVKEIGKEAASLPAEFVKAAVAGEKVGMARFKNGVNNGPGSWDSLKMEIIPGKKKG